MTRPEIELVESTAQPLVLVVEDDLATRRPLVELVKSHGFRVAEVSGVAAAKRELARNTPALVLSDIVLPDGSGVDLLPVTDGPPMGTDFVFVTGQATVETVVAALRRGVLDYLTKPIDVERLASILRDVARSRTAGSVGALTLEEAERTGTFGRLIGRSRPMVKLYAQILKVARTQATVLLQGDTGTGKELVARTIHDLSDRCDEAFVELNCGAVSATLIESELFGHEQGSFTGATRRHIGVFERAHEGTLFLDEITEMPLELQVKILRVLETRSFSRVGGEKPIASAGRLIAATNRSPEEAVREGKLREDLFYRLRVFPIHLPALQRRPGDIELLARRFLEAHDAAEGTRTTFAPEAVEWLNAQPWQGNVRELKNLMQRAYILADGVIDVSCLQIVDEDDSAGALPAGDEVRIPVGTSIAAAERQIIEATLARFRGDKAKAARVLGISLKTLYTRLSAYRGVEA